MFQAARKFSAAFDSLQAQLITENYKKMTPSGLMMAGKLWPRRVWPILRASARLQLESDKPCCYTALLASFRQQPEQVSTWLSEYSNKQHLNLERVRSA